MTLKNKLFVSRCWKKKNANDWGLAEERTSVQQNKFGEEWVINFTIDKHSGTLECLNIQVFSDTNRREWYFALRWEQDLRY